MCTLPSRAGRASSWPTTLKSGTRSAAFGGNTLVMPFCIQEKGKSLRAALTEYHAKAKGKCYVDTAFTW